MAYRALLPIYEYERSKINKLLSEITISNEFKYTGRALFRLRSDKPMLSRTAIRDQSISAVSFLLNLNIFPALASRELSSCIFMTSSCAI